MTFASDKLYNEYLRRNMAKFASVVKVREIVLSLPCLTMSDQEEIEAKRSQVGNYNAIQLLLESLRRREKWPEQLIDALRRCEHNTLADEVEEKYNSFKVKPNLKSPSPATTVVRVHVHPAPTPNLSLPIPESTKVSTAPPPASAPPAQPSPPPPSPPPAQAEAPPASAPPAQPSPPPVPAPPAQPEAPPAQALPASPVVPHPEPVQAAQLPVASGGPPQAVQQQLHSVVAPCDPKPPPSTTPIVLETPPQKAPSPPAAAPQEVPNIDLLTSNDLSVTSETDTAVPHTETPASSLAEPIPTALAEASQPLSAPPDPCSTNTTNQVPAGLSAPPFQIEPPPTTTPVPVPPVQAIPPTTTTTTPVPATFAQTGPPPTTESPPAPAPASRTPEKHPVQDTAPPVTAVVPPAQRPVEHSDPTVQVRAEPRLEDLNQPPTQPTGAPCWRPVATADGPVLSYSVEFSKPGVLHSVSRLPDFSLYSGDSNRLEISCPVPGPEAAAPAPIVCTAVSQDPSPSASPAPCQENGVLEEHTSSTRNEPEENQFDSTCQSSLGDQEVLTNVGHVYEEPSVLNHQGQTPSMLGNAVSSLEDPLVENNDSQSQIMLGDGVAGLDALNDSSQRKEVCIAEDSKSQVLNGEATRQPISYPPISAGTITVSCASSSEDSRHSELEEALGERKPQNQENTQEKEDLPKKNSIIPKNSYLLAGAAVGVCALFVAWRLKN